MCVCGGGGGGGGGGDPSLPTVNIVNFIAVLYYCRRCSSFIFCPLTGEGNHIFVVLKFFSPPPLSQNIFLRLWLGEDDLEYRGNITHGHDPTRVNCK